MKIGEKRAEMVARLVAEKLEGVTVSVKQVMKNNDQKKIGLLIESDVTTQIKEALSTGSAGTSPVVYLDEMEVSSLAEAADKVIRAYNNSEKSVATTTITNWDNAKDNLVLALVNKSANEDWLKDKVYQEFLDLAIIYKVVVQIGSQTGTVTVTKQLLDRWGVTEKELDRAARESSPKKAPVSNPSLLKILNDALKRTGQEEIQAPMPFEPFTIVTNKAAVNGAAVILYDGVLDALSKTKGGDFYIIPSSIHEVLALGTDVGSPAELGDMIKSVNETQLAPEDVLADHAYFYDASAKELQIA